MLGALKVTRNLIKRLKQVFNAIPLQHPSIKTRFERDRQLLAGKFAEQVMTTGVQCPKMGIIDGNTYHHISHEGQLP